VKGAALAGGSDPAIALRDRSDMNVMAAKVKRKLKHS
jgi:hypothetical protein